MKKALRKVFATIILNLILVVTTTSAVAADVTERNSIECAPAEAGYLETLPGPAISFREEQIGLPVVGYKMSQIAEMAESAGYDPAQMEGAYAAFSHVEEKVDALIWLDSYGIWVTLQTRESELPPAIICYPVTYRGATIETTHPIVFPVVDPILEN